MSTRERNRSVVVAGVVAAALIACTPRAKEEAAQLAQAVEHFRAAPNEAKGGPALAAVQGAPCEDVAVCEAKKECVLFAERTAAGLAAKSEVERVLADVQAGKLRAEDPAAQALPGKLDDASRFLKEGEAALLRCDDRIIRLKREWRL